MPFYAQNVTKNELEIVYSIFVYLINTSEMTPGVHSQEMPGTELLLDGSQFLSSGIDFSISAIWYKDGSQFLPLGIKRGIDFQTPV